MRLGVWDGLVCRATGSDDGFVRGRDTGDTLDDKNPDGWVPEQKIKLSEAVEAYTMGSAFAEFQEKEKGSITPGKLADMVLLSDDIFKLDPKKIWDVQVDLTMMGGKSDVGKGKE